jgi:hypothetical protein
MKTNYFGDSLTLIYGFFSAVSLIFLQKYLFSVLFFNAPYFLLFLNYSFGFVVCVIISSFMNDENYTFKILPLKDHVLISIVGSFSVIFGSLSLIHNSIGFFQVNCFCFNDLKISKILVVPFQIAIEHFFYQKKTNVKIIFSVVVLLVGVSLVAVNDVSVNFIGIIYAFLCIISTSMVLILKSNLMETTNISPFHLLVNSSLISAFISLIPSPIFDEWKSDYLEWKIVFGIILSCIIALNSNFSLLLVLKRTSTLTHLVVSQLKTLSLIVIGNVMFNSMPNFGYFCGVLLSAVGSTWYAQIRHTINTKEQNELHEEKFQDINK